MGNTFYKNLIQNAPLGYAFCKIILNSQGEPYDFQFIEVNDNTADLFGMSRCEILGSKFTKLFPVKSPNMKYWIETFGDIALNGNTLEFEEFMEPLGAWLHIKAFSPEKGYFVTWVNEISKDRLIARISEEFLQLKDEIDYQRIADYILGVSGAHYAFFYLYHDSYDCFEFKASSGFRDDTETLTRIINSYIIKSGYDFKEQLDDHNIVNQYNSLTEFLSKLENKNTTQRPRMLDNFSNGETLTIKIKINNVLIGLFILVMPEHKKMENPSIVLLYTRQVGLLITRNRAEQEIIRAHNKLVESSKRLQKAEEIAHIGNWEFDLITGKMIWSDELYRIIGFPPNSFKPSYRRVVSTFHPEDRYKMKGIIDKALKTHEIYEMEIRIIRPDGDMRWVLLKGYTQFDDDKKPIKASGSVLDITENKLMEKALIQEKERLRITLLSVGDGVIAVDKEGRIEVMNEVASRLTGYSPEEAEGKDFNDICYIVHEYTKERNQNTVSKVLKTGCVKGLTNHLVLISKDGKETPIAYSAAPIKDKTGAITGVVMVIRDVTEEKENQKEILYLSFHDQLTGLYNRFYFNMELQRLDTPRNYPLGIIITDINGLKLTNDAFGHAMGDKLLKKAAEIIKEHLRTDDILARLAGDEFAILLPKISEEDIEKIVKRMRVAISRVTVDSVVLSVSIGWAIKTSSDQDINKVIQKADDYMYRRKLFESPSMRGKTLQTMLSTLHEKNIREKNHSERVSFLCEKIGRALGFTEEKVDELRTVGLMHDIGKIAIDESILNKKGSLSSEDVREIQRHPEIGYRILSSVNAMSEMAEYILAHHERWDGKGYPKGLKGEDIPIEARIISVADAYDAMITGRPYKKPMKIEDVVDELRRHSGTQFDKHIVSVFIDSVLKKNLLIL